MENVLCLMDDGRDQQAVGRSPRSGIRVGDWYHCGWDLILKAC